jgi:hypothetical protein
VTADSDRLPDDTETLKAMLVAERAARIAAEALAEDLAAQSRARTLEIERLKFLIGKPPVSAAWTTLGR